MDDAVVAAVERRVSLGARSKGRVCGGEAAVEAPRAVPVSPRASGTDPTGWHAPIVETWLLRISRRRRWNSAPSGSVTSASPGRDDAVPCRREEPQALAERFRIPRRLDDVVRATPPRRGRTAAPSASGSTASSPSRRFRGARASGSLPTMVAPLLQEKDAGEDSDRAEPQDGHNLAVANAGIERDLQRCLHKRERASRSAGRSRRCATSAAETTKRL